MHNPAARSLPGQHSCGTASTRAATPDHTLLSGTPVGEAILRHPKCSSLGLAQPGAVVFNTTSFGGASLYIFAHAFGRFSGNWTLFSSPNAFPLHHLLTVCSPSCSPGVCAAQLMLDRCWCSRPACRYLGGWDAVLSGSHVQCVGLPLGGAAAQQIPSAQHRVQAGDHYGHSCFPWRPNRAAGVTLKVPFGA